MAVSYRPLTAEVLLSYGVIPYGICGKQSGNGGNRFFSQYFGFHLSVSFHNFSILIFTLKLVFLEWQVGKA
jgi:hypothetical protein